MDALRAWISDHSQREAARIMDVSEQFMSLVLKGDRDLPAKRALRFSRATGIPIDQLVPDLPPQKRPRRRA